MQTTFGQVSTEQHRTKKEKAFQAVLDNVVDDKKVFGTSFAIKTNSLSWIGCSGDLSAQQPYFIASTTKLFTTAIILHLRAEGKLKLDEILTMIMNSPQSDNNSSYPKPKLRRG
jgi:hypothetical protein